MKKDGGDIMHSSDEIKSLIDRKKNGEIGFSSDSMIPSYANNFRDSFPFMREVIGESVYITHLFMLLPEDVFDIIDEYGGFLIEC